MKVRYCHSVLNLMFMNCAHCSALFQSTFCKLRSTHMLQCSTCSTITQCTNMINMTWCWTQMMHRLQTSTNTTDWPFDAHCCHMSTGAIKHPVPDWVKPSFVILTSGHSDVQGWASECPDIKNYKWRLYPVWHRMLYSCTCMATVDVKGLKQYW